MAVSERKRLILTTLVVILVGIVTGLFLGDGLLPSAADLQYNERATTTNTTTRTGHSHDGLLLHEHIITTAISTKETTPHYWFHDFAPATTSTPSGTAPTRARATNEVMLYGNDYTPASITVPVGTTVTWTHLTSEAHSVTSVNGLFNALLTFGESFSWTFTVPGIYNYTCDPHPYMFGTVIVK